MAKQRSVAATLWQCALFVSLFVSTATAERATTSGSGTVQQRLTLASHLIQRIASSARGELEQELESLQARFLIAVDEALVGDANAFFQKVVTRYRATREQREPDDQAQEDRRRYEGKLSELESFRESYVTLLRERRPVAQGVLDEHTLAARVARAAQLAAQAHYSEAYAVVDGAYHQLIVAMKKLRDRETVEYRLQFDTPADEFAYEQRRFESQKMLLDMMVAERQPAEETLRLIRGLEAAAHEKLAAARQLAAAGAFAQAVATQEDAVADLTRAMRLVGVYF